LKLGGTDGYQNRPKSRKGTLGAAYWTPNGPQKITQVPLRDP